ncbi:hypothetical protein R1flu_019498 [Riccia fluitans]|uniref:DUF1995 domain-containing protein n=1 Tax=Riccia fluitans TaxID=41844 RepID=A0ABD1ZJ59_9MARC
MALTVSAGIVGVAGIAPQRRAPVTRSDGFLSSFGGDAQRISVALCGNASIHQRALKFFTSRNFDFHRVKASARVEAAASDSAAAGVDVYRPASYDVLVSDAASAVAYALDSGKLRMEVDFPPLPSSVSGYKGQSDEFIDANIQLAITLGRKLNELKGITSKIVFPDLPEKRRASRIFKSALELTTCISFGCLDDIRGGAAKNFFGQIRNVLDFDFGEDVEGPQNATPDVYIVVNSTTNELPDVEQYVESFAKSSPVILFNLETDTLRSDLGLFGFPSKDIHYRFLSQYMPVFYIRQRDYSKSIPVAPFILNYSGALFRKYPGPWQVMLKQVDGSYACIAEARERYTLGQAKEELLTSLGLQEEEGSTLAFLRRGYKTTTWWEDDIDLEESSAWRS